MLDLAKSLGVRAASVTGMIKKLASLDLVEHEPYKGVHLTGLGEKIAIEVLRHHRLLELYLARHLNYEWDEIHEEAERLEHVISEKFEAAISKLLGDPTHDPHGDPIPSVDLEFPDSPKMLSLNQIKNDIPVIIGRVISQDPDILNMLSRLELTIGQRVEKAGSDETGIRLKIKENKYLIPHAISKYIFCKDID